jgi:hypothetical protein
MPIRPRSGRQRVMRQKKIMFQFSGAGLFETEHLATPRIHAGRDVPDGTVFSGAVHPLKNQQQRITVGRALKLLARA